MKLKYFFYLPIAIISTVGFTSCLDDDDDPVDITPGFVSFVNATPDTTALDFYINGQPISESSVNYTERIPEESYIEAAPSQYGLTVTLPNSNVPIINNGAVPIQQDLYHSVFIYNIVEDMQGMILVDDLVSPASGMAKVRFLHLSPDAPALDLAVEGETTAWFSDYEFEDFSEEYEEVEASSYSLQIRDSSTDEALVTESVNLENGKAYTLWVKGLSEGSGQRALGLESIEHVAATP